MNIKKFIQQNKGGPVTTEYVIFVAAIGIILIVGVTALFNGMKNLFNAWAVYFSGS